MPAIMIWPAVSIPAMAGNQSAAVEVTESKDRGEVKLRHEDRSARSSGRWEYNEADLPGARVYGCSLLSDGWGKRMNERLMDVL